MTAIVPSLIPTRPCERPVTSDRPPLGRRSYAGIGLGPTKRLPTGHSLLIVGPTQAGKTSSLVLPAVLSWRGPMVVTSVKGDIVDVVSAWRASLGSVQRLEPGSATGATWDPLDGVRDRRHALRVAKSLTSSSGRGDTEFWNALATKLVGGLFWLATRSERTIFDVAAAIDDRSWERWDDEEGCVRPFRSYDHKTLDAVVTTAEAMVLPWQFPQPLASVRSSVSGSNTLFLCSPRHEHVSYEPLFRGALRMVIEEQQSRIDAGTAQPLLLVLDEAANVASLDELDQLASTVSGLGVTLVTVVQDFAQLQARWGQRAATIVNNHATRMVLSGLADPSVSTYLPEVTAPKKKDAVVVPLRQRPGSTALVVSGRSPVYAVRLRPWWRHRTLRRRGQPPR